MPIKAMPSKTTNRVMARLIRFSPVKSMEIFHSLKF
jgi:hypothetical protein